MNVQARISFFSHTAICKVRKDVSFPELLMAYLTQVNLLMHQFANHQLPVTPPVNKHVDSAKQLQD